MDISALANGTTRCERTWQNAAGHQLVFNDKGLVLQTARLQTCIVNGLWNGFWRCVQWRGFLLELCSKGVKLANKENFKIADANKIVNGQELGMNNFDEQGQFYYIVCY